MSGPLAGELLPDTITLSRVSPAANATMPPPASETLPVTVELTNNGDPVSRKSITPPPCEAVLFAIVQFATEKFAAEEPLTDGSSRKMPPPPDPALLPEIVQLLRLTILL